MHPFSHKTIYAIILAFVIYTICYYTFLPFHGFLGILVKSYRLYRLVWWCYYLF